MKKSFKFILQAFMMLAMVVALAACENEEPEVTPTPNPDEPEQTEPEPEPEPEPEAKVHTFDIVVSIGEHGGMNSGDGTIVRRVNRLEADQPMIDFAGKGVDITADYTLEAITKGKYYYQVPLSGDRFVKYEIVADNQAPKVVASQPFKDGITYKVRNYTHAWLDDNTLLIMSVNSDKDKFIWTKLNAENLSIIAQGVIDEIEFANEDATQFSSSGILTYRESDKKLFYFYTEAKKKEGSSRTTKFPGIYTLVLNPQTMAIEKHHVSLAADEMAGSAYGELLQNIIMYDEAGTMYMAGLTSDDNGYLLRIKKGETEFDAEYNGYKDPDGKLLTIQYLGNGKAFIYSRNNNIPDPEKPEKFLSGISDYLHYYSILDVNTGVRTRLQYEGTDIPYSAGRFAQRSVVVDDKVYFGVTTQEAANPCIYIYDIKSGKVEKGVEISEGFYFDTIRLMDEE